jgi:heat shock protein HslJ
VEEVRHDRLVRTEELATGDAEHQAVAELADDTGDGDANGDRPVDEMQLRAGVDLSAPDRSSPGSDRSYRSPYGVLMGLPRRRRRWSGQLGFLVGLLVVLTVSACSSDEGSAPEPDTSTTSPAEPTGIEGDWVLKSFGAPGQQTDAPMPHATITFDSDESFHGTTPCNAMAGSWTKDGDQITLEFGPMTLVACADPAGQAQEAAITAGFPSISTSAVSDDTLTLSGGATSFTFTQQPKELVGRHLLTGVSDGRGAIVSDETIANFTLEFADDGYVRWDHGCGAQGASYHATAGGSLSFDMFGGETRACSGANLTIQQQLKAALMAAASWERDETATTLRDSSGTTQLTMMSIS